MSKKGFLLGVVLVAVVGGLSWQFLIKPRLPLYQAYEGTLLRAYEIYDPDKDSSEPHRPKYLAYDHYWRIKTSAGTEMEVKVPYKTWGQAKEGDAVEKNSGQRFPRLKGPAAPRPAGAAALPEVPPTEPGRSTPAVQENATPPAS